MPCYDSRDSKDASLMARFCCEQFSLGVPVPDYMKEWWEAHQEWDAAHGRPHTVMTHDPKDIKRRMERKR